MRDKDVGAARFFIMMMFLWQKEADLQFCCLFAYTAACSYMFAEFIFSKVLASSLLGHRPCFLRNMAQQTVAARSPMQDWTMVPEFLTEELWSFLQDDRNPQLAKLDALVSYLIAMGLRHPSEATQSVLTALLTCVVPDGTSLRQDARSYHSLFQTVKGRVKAAAQKARSAGTPVFEYVLTLPASPALLSANMQQHFFPQGGFASPINVGMIQQHAGQCPLRKTNSAVSVSWPGAPAAASVLNAGCQEVMFSLLQTALQSQQRAGGAESQPLRIQYLQPGGRSSSSASSGDRAGCAIVENEAAPRLVSMPSLLQLEDNSERRSSTVAVAAGQEAAAAAEALAVPHPHSLLKSAAAAPLLGAQEAATATPPPRLRRASSSPGQQAVGPALGAVLQDLAQTKYGQAWSPWRNHGAGQAEGAAKRKAAEFEGDSATQHVEENSAACESEPAAAVRRRPSGQLQKRPAAAQQTVMQKPAASSDAVLRRPAAAGLTAITREKSFKLFPTGCSKCRHRTGCTPSCLAKKGYSLL